MATAQEEKRSQKEHCVVIVGAGFSGFNAARELSRLAGATTEIVVINSTDYFLYLPLMPQVAGGLVEPRHICVGLSRRLGKTRFVLGTVQRVDPQQKVVSWAGPEGASGQVRYDRLILTAGSVNKLLPIPGLAGQQIRWMLLDTAPRLLPDLDARLSKTADRVLRRRGVEVRTGQSVTEALDGYVQLSTGEKVPTRSLIWCVGVRADPLVDGLDVDKPRA